MNFQVSALFANEVKLKEIISQKPEAQIIHILSHEQKPGYKQVVIDRVTWEDEFGLPVYLCQVVDWEGELTDLDERYAGTGLTSNDLMNL